MKLPGWAELIFTCLCMLVTAILFSVSVASKDQAADGEFRRLSEDGVQVLQTRMQTYLQALQGTAAFLRVADKMSHAAFADYVSQLEAKTLLPGVSGIGFVQSVPDAEIDDYLRRTRQDGQPDYTIKNLTGAQTHYLVKYIYPINENLNALGLDVTFEPVRREVLELARDTGEAQLTPPIHLLQHAKEQAGFLLLVPYFAKAGASLADQNGKGEFLGWVYAPFIAKNLLSDLTPSSGDSYTFHLFDGSSALPEKMIFENHLAGETEGAHSATYTVEQFGRPWTIVFHSTPRFDNAFESNQPAVILLVGILLTALLLSLFRAINRRSEAMREVADLRTRQVESRDRENQAIVENDVIAVFVLDADDVVLFSNRAAQIMLRHDDPSLSGLKFSDLIKEIKTSGEQQDYNAHGAAQTGPTLFLDLQRNEWTNADGHGRTTAIVRDVTAQIKAQEDLTRAKTLYDMALEAGQIGVFDFNFVTGKMEVSGTWLRNMGYDEDVFDIDPQAMFYSRVHPDDLLVMMRTEKDCTEGLSERAVSEFRVKFGENEWRWIRSDSSIVERAEDGTATRMIGTEWDVTELYQARNALEVSEQRFRQVVAAAPVGMALVDSKGQFVLVNDAFCKLCGVSEDRITQDARLADMMPREDIKEIYIGVSAITLAANKQTYSAQHRILRSNGEIRWGLFNISWTYDRNTDENFYIVQINDITDQKRLDQIKNEFVATVSHELRTPLTSIKGALDLVKGSSDRPLPKMTARLVEIARSNADRLSSIVNDILDLEKISSGEVAFNFETHDLAPIISAAIEEMSPFALTHGNQLTLHLPDDPLNVRVDASRIKQVLANLISNACKYSSKDTKVLIKAERIDDFAIVYIQNFGPGVPESFQSKIFQAFSQADSTDTRAIGGTGLGLNITRKIIKRHEGEIGFESVANGVTVFWFTCPISKELEQQDEPFSAASDVHLTDSPAEKMTVLHFEEDKDFAEVIASALAPVANVIHATSLTDAAQISASTFLDAVILDCALPGDDVRIFLDKLAARQPGAHLIGLSADEDQTRDPRLLIDLIKSRSELPAIVKSVKRCLARAS
ncbi:CHASE domain-containing protein [Roseovarius arcticus]|uniref:CHASE domain-containing protein n=1 Tax=Roseovarius arcticus TaxID=2547404 RepID=UPI001FE9A37B|nr:CHASE domain-containing protein [Roseovarius arcticus]